MSRGPLKVKGALREHLRDVVGIDVSAYGGQPSILRRRDEVAESRWVEQVVQAMAQQAVLCYTTSSGAASTRGSRSIIGMSPGAQVSSFS